MDYNRNVPCNQFFNHDNREDFICSSFTTSCPLLYNILLLNVVTHSIQN